MKITGAIFDMDGTLLNSMDYWAIAASEYLRGLGITPFDSEDRHFLEDGMKVWYESAVKNHGLTASYDEVGAGIYKIMDKYYESEVCLKDGVYEMLEALKAHGVKMCIASATDKEYVKKILTRLGIMDYFSAIFTSKEVGKGKRFPLIYQVAMEYLGTDPETTYVFEDAIYAMRTAYGAGFRVVGIYDKNVYATEDEVRANCHIYLDKDNMYRLDI